MNRFRTPRGRRVTFGLMILSLLPLALAPFGIVRRQAVAQTYAEWVRNRLNGPKDEAFEMAVATAVAARPVTLDHFVEVFIAEFQASLPESLPEGQLAVLLKPLLFGGVPMAGDTALPHLEDASWKGPVSRTDRPARGMSLDADPGAFPALAASHVGPVHPDRPRTPLRVLSSAHPLGP